MSEGIPVLWMRGGTSKGGYFLASDLPDDPADRDTLLLDIMGSPDPRQIDGMGGADPLTSKVAVIRKSARDGVDVDYLFLQVFVDQPIVTDAQNCGNILAGVAPFAIERGLVTARHPTTQVTVFMENTGQIAVVTAQTPDGRICYDGTARIDGVPGTSAPVAIEFRDTAGSSCGALLPSGNASDWVDGTHVTMIDNGMPCVILRACDLGITGHEAPADLEANEVLRRRLENIRMKAGPLMNLGDVREKSVPKMTLLSPPLRGGAVMSRTFIPHTCHKAIGVLGAVSVATACLTEGAVGSDLTARLDGTPKSVSVEHPGGAMTIIAHMENGAVDRTEVLRTSRKLMDGVVFA